MPDLYIGLMSGTSMDGVDAALVDFTRRKPQLIATHSQAWPKELLEGFEQAKTLSDIELLALEGLDRNAGVVFAETTLALLQKAGAQSRDITAIGSHGQTIRHQPDAEEPFSLQIGSPEVIAKATGIDVIADFRTADIEAGGQGAPLAPAYHQAVFSDDRENRVIVNIGGIANLTVLPADETQPVIGFDSGPGNTLMDAWIKTVTRYPYDEDGAWAASGKTNKVLLKYLMRDDYFKLAPPKSTGFEYFNLDWLHNYLNDDLEPEDIQATLCDLTATSIADAIHRYAADTQQVLVCGGGAHNAHLMYRLEHYLPNLRLESTAALGTEPDWVEAMAFAWLARQHVKERPGNLPSVTGAQRTVILGRLTKASQT